MKKNIYEEITNIILEQLENGVIPWHKPWSGGGFAVSHATGKYYSLLNQMLLGMSGGEWLTFKQVQEAGGRVKKGEHGKPVVFWSFLQKKDEDGELIINDITGEPETIPYLKKYIVFEVSQCDGIDYKHIDPKTFAGFEIDPIEEAEKVASEYISRENIAFRTQHRCGIRPSMDAVRVPNISRFENAEEYYSTLYHELTHSTGHKARLDRQTLTKTAAFGSNDYSKEELVAENGFSYEPR